MSLFRFQISPDPDCWQVRFFRDDQPIGSVLKIPFSDDTDKDRAFASASEIGSRWMAYIVKRHPAPPSQ